MAMIDESFDEAWFCEILKNEELMKALGPRNPNWFDDLNKEAEKKLIAKKAATNIPKSSPAETKCNPSSSITPKPAEEIPSSFSFTQALEAEEKHKIKFLYPGQLNNAEEKFVANELNVPPTHSCHKTQETKCSQKDAVAHFERKVAMNDLNDNFLRDTTTMDKSDSKQHGIPNVTPSKSERSISSNAVDGSTSPVLRKCRSAVRRRTKGVPSTHKLPVPTTPVLHSATGSETTPKSSRTLPQKRPQISQIEEYNPWKKKSTLGQKCEKVAGVVKAPHTPVPSSDVRTAPFQSRTSGKITPVVMHGTNTDSKRSAEKPPSSFSDIAKKIVFDSANDQESPKALKSANTNKLLVDNVQGNANPKAQTKAETLNSFERLSVDGGTVPQAQPSAFVEPSALKTHCVGFQTASKKSLQVSAASWKRAADLVASIDKPNSGKIAHKHCAERGLTVSKDAWKKACNLVGKSSVSSQATTIHTHSVFQTSLEALQGTGSFTTGANTVTNAPTKNHVTGFTTASRKAVTVSSESWKKAQCLVEADDAAVKLTGFNTASSKPLSISKQSWEKVQHLFSDNNKGNEMEKACSDAANSVQSAVPPKCHSGAPAQSVLTPISKVSNVKFGTFSEKRAIGQFGSCPKAKRRNSSYKPPRRKISLGGSEAKLSSLVSSGFDSTINKENVGNHLNVGVTSAKRKLGLKHKQEDQINISDESLLMAMELFENV